MVAPTLMALPDIVLVDQNAGQTSGTTRIFYEVDSPNEKPHLWERIVATNWQPIALVPPMVQSSPSGDPYLSARRSS